MRGDSVGCLGGFFVVLACACSSAQPPRGPKHTPSNSDEATTPCPDERREAQEARESLLGAETSERKEAAAAAVLVHARCEARAAEAIPTPSGNQDRILAGLRRLREQTREATNLFEEVRRYGSGPNSATAFVDEAAATLVFASRVEAIAIPEELDERARGEFAAELSEAVRTLRERAELSLRQGIANAGGDTELEARACALLRELGKGALCESP